jgi:uncharacterized membrane protein
MDILKGFYDRKKLIKVFMLLCFGAFLLVLLRQFLPTGKSYLFLLWNLFLALIPLVISTLIAHRHNMPGAGKPNMALSLGWLVFFPNAPYMLTDYVHVFYGGQAYFTLNLFTWAYIALIAFAAALISLNDISNVLQQHYHYSLVYLVILIICLVTGFGIYLGRDLRFNSWDVLIKPHDILNESINSFRNPYAAFYTWVRASIISLLLFGAYLVLKVFDRRLFESKQN